MPNSPNTPKPLEKLDELSSQHSASWTKLAEAQALSPHGIFADRYMILEKIGEGGMGAVYKVKHVHMGNLFALKVLNSQSTTSEVFRRFEQEASIVSRMRHPNIVTIHDFGIADGQAYLVMDYLEGHSLGETAKSETALNLERFQRLMLQTCSALAHAHENGIVHRDLKPANIIVVSPPEGPEQAVLVDFGIAKIMPRQDETRGALTQTGAVIGSPYYMSPEQCQGLNIDLRSDIYSLGCVMYELLVGQSPFQGENLLNTAFMHLNDAPKPFPSHLRKSLQERQIEAIVLKSLAKSPDERYQSTIELASDLKQAERCSEGFWSSIKTFFKTANARKNSSQKTAWFQRYGLPLLSVVAMCTAMALLWLPYQMSDSAAKVDLNRQLIGSVDNLLLSTKQKKTADQMNRDAKANLRLVGDLAASCRTEPQKLELIRRVEDTAKKSLATTYGIHKSLKNIVRQFLSGGFGDRGPDVDFESSFVQCASTWEEGAVACSELRSVAYRDLAQQQQRLQTCTWLFLLLRCTGVVVDASLLVMLVMRFSSKLLPPGLGRKKKAA